MAMRTIGHRIRAARTLKGFTQERLALAAGITREWLGKIEKGQSTTLDIVLSITLCLGIAPEAFFRNLDLDNSEDFTAALKFMSQYL